MGGRDIPRGLVRVDVSCCCVFFFSSRRRHTRFDCDWSSDVCSSDLVEELLGRGFDVDVVCTEGLASPPPRGEGGRLRLFVCPIRHRRGGLAGRSEEHTSELQSQSNLVCRLLLEKKDKWRQ